MHNNNNAPQHQQLAKQHLDQDEAFISKFNNFITFHISEFTNPSGSTMSPSSSHNSVVASVMPSLSNFSAAARAASITTVPTSTMASNASVAPSQSLAASQFFNNQVYGNNGTTFGAASSIQVHAAEPSKDALLTALAYFLQHYKSPLSGPHVASIIYKLEQAYGFPYTPLVQLFLSELVFSRKLFITCCDVVWHLVSNYINKVKNSISVAKHQHQQQMYSNNNCNIYAPDCFQHIGSSELAFQLQQQQQQIFSNNSVNNNNPSDDIDMSVSPNDNSQQQQQQQQQIPSILQSSFNNAAKMAASTAQNNELVAYHCFTFLHLHVPSNHTLHPIVLKEMFPYINSRKNIKFNILFKLAVKAKWIAMDTQDEIIRIVQQLIQPLAYEALMHNSGNIGYSVSFNNSNSSNNKSSSSNGNTSESNNSSSVNNNSSGVFSYKTSNNLLFSSPAASLLPAASSSRNGENNEDPSTIRSPSPSPSRSQSSSVIPKLPQAPTIASLLLRGPSDNNNPKVASGLLPQGISRHSISNSNHGHGHNHHSSQTDRLIIHVASLVSDLLYAWKNYGLPAKLVSFLEDEQVLATQVVNVVQIILKQCITGGAGCCGNSNSSSSSNNNNNSSSNTLWWWNRQQQMYFVRQLVMMNVDCMKYEKRLADMFIVNNNNGAMNIEQHQKSVISSNADQNFYYYNNNNQNNKHEQLQNKRLMVGVQTADIDGLSSVMSNNSSNNMSPRQLQQHQSLYGGVDGSPQRRSTISLAAKKVNAATAKRSRYDFVMDHAMTSATPSTEPKVGLDSSSASQQVLNNNAEHQQANSAGNSGGDMQIDDNSAPLMQRLHISTPPDQQAHMVEQLSMQMQHVTLGSNKKQKLTQPANKI